MSNDKARKQVIQEIRDTEQRYLDSLITLSKEYVAKIVERKFITDSAFTELFTTLETIINFSRDLFKKLKRSDEVGKVFLTVIPVLKTYSEYFHCHEKATLLVSQSNNNEFTQWLKDTENECSQRGLQTFA
jgi:hypothetical protein